MVCGTHLPQNTKMNSNTPSNNNNSLVDSHDNNLNILDLQDIEAFVPKLNPGEKFQLVGDA
jgi:hypothetical protein